MRGKQIDKGKLFVKIVTRVVLAFWLISLLIVTNVLAQWLSNIPLHKILSVIALIIGFIIASIVIEGAMLLIKRFSITIAGEKITGDIIFVYGLIIFLTAITIYIIFFNHLRQ